MPTTLAQHVHTGDTSMPRLTPLPGDLAIWIFIFAELLVFGVFFISFAIVKSQNALLFHTGQQLLHTGWGLINTLLLITSSYCMAEAVARRQSAGPLQQQYGWLAAAMLLGLCFIVMKLHEFHDDAQHGITLSSSLFALFYLSMTFFHFMHVLLGLVILAVVGWRLQPNSAPEDHALETAASYWHMVDLVWIILFMLVYVLP